jgi:hypothetical protein
MQIPLHHDKALQCIKSLNIYHQGPMFYSYMQVEYLLPILQILIMWGSTSHSIWS